MTDEKQEATAPPKRGPGRPPKNPPADDGGVSRALRARRDESAFTPEQVQLLNRTILGNPHATADDRAIFLAVCNRTHLDPFMRQIYAVWRYDKRMNREVMIVQTGIDGYRMLAARTAELAGVDDAIFEEREGQAYPVKATVTVYRMVKGVRCPFTGTARWSEYAQRGKDGDLMGLWGRMPYGQLAKCAEALAIRKGFSSEVGPVRTDDEMDQAANQEAPMVIQVPTITPGPTRLTSASATSQTSVVVESPKPPEEKKPEPPKKAPAGTPIEQATQQAINTALAELTGGKSRSVMLSALKDLAGVTRTAEMTDEQGKAFVAKLKTVGAHRGEAEDAPWEWKAATLAKKEEML